jgi:hypothetical protein
MAISNKNKQVLLILRLSISANRLIILDWESGLLLSRHMDSFYGILPAFEYKKIVKL